MIRWVAAALLVFLILPAMSAMAQDASLGTTYEASVPLGSRTFPLPDGRWTVVASNGKGRVWLAQMQGDRLSRWVYLSTNLQWNSGGWGRNKDICDRTDVHAAESDSNHSAKDIECWMLEQRGMTLGAKPDQGWVDFYRWSDNRGRPNTALSLSYYFVRNGDFFRADYFFNPVVAGFPETPTAEWRGSPWHVDMAAKDPKKLDYLRSLKGIGDGLLSKLRKVLQ